jgi:DNA-binding MarR family transcriptional regulator
MDKTASDELPLVRPHRPGLVGPLVVHLARRIRAETDCELEAFNLRARHVVALTLLRTLGEQSQASLAETLRMNSVNVVGLLNELEAAGLIQRRRFPQDRRRHTVAISTTGIHRLAEVEEALAGAEARVLAALDADQLASFQQLLQIATATAATDAEEPIAVAAARKPRNPAARPKR